MSEIVEMLQNITQHQHYFEIDRFDEKKFISICRTCGEVKLTVRGKCN